MKVLLIWEEIPENTKLYLLEGDLADKAVAAHGCYVNIVDGDPEGAADRLSTALEGVESLVNGPLLLDEPTTVVRSGFMM